MNEFMKILIVEDEVLIALSYEMAIKNFSNNMIDIAYTGEEAVSKALNMLPDVILMDIQLKGIMNGIEAAIEIKKNHDIPLIYITGNSDDSTRKTALETEPIDYMEKPVDMNRLFVLLKNLEK